ncbi:MAG: hypothetical protein ACD_76C00096G0003 [uncultured bacterium]|nr:MAG: hypothetical protein ACD_76C00096G0003 [uncultured bacterium]HBD05507.1 D-glycerate dehydrogenase [Candidatus Uhrbacteria bacterium]
MTKIFVTRDIPDQGLKMLAKIRGVKLDIYKHDNKIPRAELKRRVSNADVLLCLLTDKIDSDIFKAGTKLRMIANYAVGFDNINISEAKKRGIVVANTPCDEVSETVAEHAVALIFALSHRIIESDAFTRAGKYHGWGPKLLLGTDVLGKTLGIIGGGRIGSALMRRMRDGFDVNIIYNDIKRNPELEKTYGAIFKTKTQLLKKSDFVSLHVPLVPQTRHLISTKELNIMKKTAFLINTSRGPIVDELALIKALEKKQIAGAGIDVYECEPFIDCTPQDTHALRKLANVILTPHTASATTEARQAMSRVAAENIIAFLKGKIPPNAIK